MADLDVGRRLKRSPNLESRKFDDEFVVLDTVANRAHALDGAAAAVWQAAEDGTLPDMSEAELEEVVAALVEGGLLVGDGISRRSLLKAGAAGGVAFVGITSLALPSAAMAASAHSMTWANNGTFTLPAGSTIMITLEGGGGGGGGGDNQSGGPGGAGGKVTGTIQNAGSIGASFTVIVGGNGIHGVTSSNGPGGAGAGAGLGGGGVGGDGHSNGGGGGGGGGSSALSFAGNPVAVAGGGGGGGGGGSSTAGSAGQTAASYNGTSATGRPGTAGGSNQGGGGGGGGSSNATVFQGSGNTNPFTYSGGGTGGAIDVGGNVGFSGFANPFGPQLTLSLTAGQSGGGAGGAGATGNGSDGTPGTVTVTVTIPSSGVITGVTGT